MKIGKERHNLNKPQNNYGGDYDCPNYDTNNYTGKEFCHDEGQMYEFIQWAQMDTNGNLICKGNRHNCIKLKFKWLASLKNKEEN